MSNKPTIIADCDIPYLKGALENCASIHYIKGSEIRANDLTKAEVLIIRTRTKCNEGLLANSSIKLIITATIGCDHIDLDYCKKAGIQVKNAAGCNARGVLQWVSAVLALDSSAQGWQPSQKCIGVVGVGNVGSIVALYAKMWGFKVLCCDPPRKDNSLDIEAQKFVSLTEIYCKADIITYHVPYTQSGIYATKHLFNDKAANTIKTDTLIINASRGEITSSSALVQESNKSRYAIDTWESEPNLDINLLKTSIISTPHIAGYTVQGKANGTATAVREVAKFYGYDLLDWYPEGIKASCPENISWEQMKLKIKDFYDISKDSNRLKENPEEFEALRNNYNYREEFF